MVLVIGKLPSVETGKDISQTGNLLSQPKKTRHTFGQRIQTGKGFLKPESCYLKPKNYPK